MLPWTRQRACAPQSTVFSKVNLVLIGYRGSGKSSVGQAVAQRLSWPLIDTDLCIEQQAGCTIAQVFSREGEAGFRRREAAVVAEVAAADGAVISVGGGAVLSSDNMNRLRAHGRVIWLRAAAEVLWHRIQRDARTAATRPNLTAIGGLDEVRRVLAQREPLYKSASNAVVDTTGKSVETVAEEVIRILAELRRSS